MFANLTKTTLLLAASLLVGGASACNVYDPSLPATPFRCGNAEPRCPDGFTCEPQGGLNVCIADEAGGSGQPDARGSALICSDDSALEPNDTLPQAYPSHVDQRPNQTITLSQLSICTDNDRDTFSIEVPSSVNITVTVELEDESVPLNLAILNANGTAVVTGTKAGNLVTAHLANAPVETLYAQVSAQAGNRNHYRVTIALDWVSSVLRATMGEVGAPVGPWS